MKKWAKRVGLVILITAAVIFWGRWLLDLFGIIKYEPPLSQDPQSIEHIELLDTSEQEYVVLYSITGEDIDKFVVDFMEIDAGRYANDPPVHHGDRTIKICYHDGGYDLLGDVVDFYSATGEDLPTGGWYYIPYDDMDAIFEKYVG